MGMIFKLLNEVRNVNEEQKKAFIRLIEDKLWIVKNKVIGVLGLAFKPDTDDMRNAPSIDIIQALAGRRGKNEGRMILKRVHNAKKILKNLTLC